MEIAAQHGYEPRNLPYGILRRLADILRLEAQEQHPVESVEARLDLARLFVARLGVPAIGCRCEVCRSQDTKDKRLRASAMVETDKGLRVLIDCGPDFRQQILTQRFGKIETLPLVFKVQLTLQQM